MGRPAEGCRVIEEGEAGGRSRVIVEEEAGRGGAV